MFVKVLLNSKSSDFTKILIKSLLLINIYLVGLQRMCPQAFLVQAVDKSVKSAII